MVMSIDQIQKNSVFNDAENAFTKNSHYNWMCQRNDFEYIAMVSIKAGYVMSTYQSSKLGLKQQSLLVKTQACYDYL